MHHIASKIELSIHCLEIGMINYIYFSFFSIFDEIKFWKAAPEKWCNLSCDSSVKAVKRSFNLSEKNIQVTFLRDYEYPQFVGCDTTIISSPGKNQDPKEDLWSEFFLSGF